MTEQTVEQACAKFERTIRLVTEDTIAFAETFAASRGEVIALQLCELAKEAARIDRAKAADLLNAIYNLYANPIESADLDRRRVIRTANALAASHA